MKSTNELKGKMVERGMSAEEIERVINTPDEATRHDGAWHHRDDGGDLIGGAGEVTPPTTQRHASIRSPRGKNARRASGWARPIVHVDAERVQIPEPVADADKAVAVCGVMHVVG